MRGHTSGLAIPTFVVDLPDGGRKVPLQPNYVLAQNEEALELRNYQGHLFHYRNPGAQNHPESSTAAGFPDISSLMPQLEGARDANWVILRS